MISKLLSTAVKLYLRSQVTQVHDLRVKILGKNKEILQGYIPQIWLSCDRAIYQGLHLSQIELNGNNIAVNLPEVIKKKPLRLIEPIFVEIELKLDAADLQASVDSELLQSGLADLWQMVLSAQNNPSAVELKNLTIEWQSIAINDQVLNLVGIYEDTLGKSQELCLSTRLILADDHTLCLTSVQITNESSFANQFQEQLMIDLGTDVAIAKLKIENNQIVCSGKIRINN